MVTARTLATLLAALCVCTGCDALTERLMLKPDDFIVERTVGINDRTGNFDTLIAAVLCTPGIADALAMVGETYGSSGSFKRSARPVVPNIIKIRGIGQSDSIIIFARV